MARRTDNSAPTKKNTTMRFGPGDLEALDELVRDRGATSRSDLVRLLVFEERARREERARLKRRRRRSSKRQDQSGTPDVKADTKERLEGSPEAQKAD